MNPRLLALGKPPRMEILDSIKRSDGLSVQELSELLALGVAGLKQHCEALCEEGYLRTGRRSKPIGRPEKIYFLTPKSDELFPCAQEGMTMEILTHAATLFGPTAPEKLLFAWFEQRRTIYAEQVKGRGLELRLQSLCKVREREGCLPVVRQNPWCLVEYHSPTAALRERYPLLTRLETDLISEVLGNRVERDEQNESGMYCCTFMPL